MSFNCNNCSVPNEALINLINYAKNRIKFIDNNFCHFAMIYITKGKYIKVISYGFNHVRKGRSVHAEVDAINNLPPITRRKKRLTKVSLLVIRLSKGLTKLADSKCCVRCCEAIYKIPPLRGYTIVNVAYSNTFGKVEDHHPISLLLEDDYHLSIYYLKRGYSPKIREKVITQPDRLTKMFINKKSLSDFDFYIDTDFNIN